MRRIILWSFVGCGYLSTWISPSSINAKVGPPPPEWVAYCSDLIVLAKATGPYNLEVQKVLKGKLPSKWIHLPSNPSHSYHLSEKTGWEGIWFLHKGGQGEYYRTANISNLDAFQRLDNLSNEAAKEKLEEVTDLIQRTTAKDATLSEIVPLALKTTSNAKQRIYRVKAIFQQELIGNGRSWFLTNGAEKIYTFGMAMSSFGANQGSEPEECVVDILPRVSRRNNSAPKVTVTIYSFVGDGKTMP